MNATRQEDLLGWINYGYAKCFSMFLQYTRCYSVAADPEKNYRPDAAQMGMLVSKMKNFRFHEMPIYNNQCGLF